MYGHTNEKEETLMSSIRRCQDAGINHTAHFEQGHFQDSTVALLPKTSSNIEKDKEAERLKQATLIETNHFSFFGSLANRILNLFIYVFWTVPASACSYFTSSNSPAVQLEERPPTLKFETIDVMIPGKGGARFTKDGKEMIGFLEP